MGIKNVYLQLFNGDALSLSRTSIKDNQNTEQFPQHWILWHLICNYKMYVELVHNYMYIYIPYSYIMTHELQYHNPLDLLLL